MVVRSDSQCSTIVHENAEEEYRAATEVRDVLPAETAGFATPAIILSVVACLYERRATRDIRPPRGRRFVAARMRPCLRRQPCREGYDVFIGGMLLTAMPLY